MGRPRSNREVARLSISLEASDYQALKNLAERNDVSAAWLVRRAVTDFLRSTNQNRESELSQNEAVALMERRS